MPREVFQRIRDLLDEQGVPYEHFQHDHVHHSADAAKVRGTKLEQAAKALVLKEKKTGRLVMFIVAGDRRLDLKIIKQAILHVKDISLAPPEEVLEKTECTVGSVPPFGKFFGMETYFDKYLKDTQEELVFSAGTHHDSIRIRTEDFLHITKPIIASFSRSSIS